MFRVFEDLLKNPEFRADKIEIAQKGMYDSISRRNDDPGQIAGREAAKLVYGPKNPYARVAEYRTVAAITRQDLIEWHGKYVHPNNLILGVVGDFDANVLVHRRRKMRSRASTGSNNERVAPSRVSTLPSTRKPPGSKAS